VWVDRADLECLSSAAIALGLALAIDPNSELADAITAGAEAACGTYHAHPAQIEVVAGLAWVVGVLDLAVTADTERLMRKWAEDFLRTACRSQ
jgi:hypothetical protein